MRAAKPEEVLRDVGRRVAELRVEREQTQAEFAEQLGVTVGYVARVEGGDENLTLTSMVKLANALSVAPAALLERPQPRKVRPGRPRQRGSR